MIVTKITATEHQDQIRTQGGPTTEIALEITSSPEDLGPVPAGPIVVPLSLDL